MCHTLHGDVRGRGRDPRKHKDFCITVNKRPSVGRRRLLQHYWYKVLVLHVIKYHLMIVW